MDTGEINGLILNLLPSTVAIIPCIVPKTITALFNV